MNDNNKEMLVAKICDGTVIDHIPSDKLFCVISLLNLDKSTTPITFGYNLCSKKLGSKAIIKISGRFLEREEVNKVSLIAPNAQIVIIRNYVVSEKIQLSLPDEVSGDVKCINPKCITSNEPMKTCFIAVNKALGLYRCYYCEREISTESMVFDKLQ